MRKLTPEEITATVAKIREKYDDYSWRYLKPRGVKQAFEERYVEALRSRVDVSSFLIAEIGAVEELIRREEARVAGPVVKEGGSDPGTGERQIATDRILEEQRRRIQGYRDVAFHAGASEEVRRMLGALATILDEHWDGLVAVLRKTAYSHRSGVMAGLEHDLRHLAWTGSGGVPTGLAHYAALLDSFPRDYGNLEREQKNYLLAASFLLHDLEDVLGRVLEAYPKLGEAAIRTVTVSREFVRGAIEDFRLRDLKRRK